MTNTVDATPKFELRALKATDIRPLSAIISKIGINKFAGALQNTAVLSTFEAIAQKGDEASEQELSYAGITAAVEVIAIIFDNYGACEEDLFKFMASVSGKTHKEIADLPLDDFAELLGAIVKMEDFGRFFKVARGLFQ